MPDAEENKKRIVRSVLERGEMSEWKATVWLYTPDIVVRIARPLRSLAQNVLAMILAVGNVPKERFQCYELRKTSRKHWIR